LDDLEGQYCIGCSAIFSSNSWAFWFYFACADS